MKNIQLHSEFKYLLRERVLKELSQYIGKNSHVQYGWLAQNIQKFKLHRNFPKVPILYVITKKGSYTVAYTKSHPFFAVRGGNQVGDIITKFQNASEQFEKRLAVAKMVYAKIEHPVFVISPSIRLEIYNEILAEVKKEFGIS